MKNVFLYLCLVILFSAPFLYKAIAQSNQPDQPEIEFPSGQFTGTDSADVATDPVNQPAVQSDYIQSQLNKLKELQEEAKKRVEGQMQETEGSGDEQGDEIAVPPPVKKKSDSVAVTQTKLHCQRAEITLPRNDNSCGYVVTTNEGTKRINMRMLKSTNVSGVAKGGCSIDITCQQFSD